MDEGSSISAAEFLRRRGVSGLRAIFQVAADLVMPPHCLACERPVAQHGALCPSCWGGLRLIERPYCEALGTPFAYDIGLGALSAEAIADPPPFQRLRAVAAFDGAARDLVHGLKYRDRMDLARWMANWMERCGGELIATADAIVPVPLHRGRLWGRRFNQSALLAQLICRSTGKPFLPLALMRTKATKQQVGLSAANRELNVRGAFRVSAEGRIALAGRRVLLVDDVYTTGATMNAATRALLRGGAASVDCLVFARVVRG